MFFLFLEFYSHFLGKTSFDEFCFFLGFYVEVVTFMTPHKVIYLYFLIQ